MKHLESLDCNSHRIDKVDFDHDTCVHQPYVQNLVPTVDWASWRVSCPYCSFNLTLTYSQKSHHGSQHPHKRANECTRHLQKRRVRRDVGGKEGKEKMLRGNAQWWVSEQISHRMYVTPRLYGRTSRTFRHLCRPDDWFYLQILFLNFHPSTKLSKAFLSCVCGKVWNVAECFCDSCVCVCVRSVSPLPLSPSLKPQTILSVNSY